MGKKNLPANIWKESKYSLYRRRIQNGVNIWHIHGEVSKDNTLMLGHEHYSGALQKMRSYLTRKKNFSPFVRGDINFDKNGAKYSWTDVFLRDDIYIVGFSLDYTEIDIWWLLSYKERQNLNSNNKVGETYFYHFYENSIDARSEAKLSLLESFGVSVKRIEILQGYEKEYDKVLAEISLQK